MGYEKRKNCKGEGCLYTETGRRKKGKMSVWPKMWELSMNLCGRIV